VRIEAVRKLLVKIGKEFISNKWNVVFINETHNFSFELEEGFQQTIPFPGNTMDENNISDMIDFLQQTLNERDDHEQSDLE
jgi:hypothetical protein